MCRLLYIMKVTVCTVENEVFPWKRRVYTDVIIVTCILAVCLHWQVETLGAMDNMYVNVTDKCNLTMS